MREIAPSQPDAPGPGTAELLAAYRQALLEAGYVGDGLPPSSSHRAGRPRTNSPEAFELFANLSSAPEVLVVLELFARASGIREEEDYAVSCLPGNPKTPRTRTRASAISVGVVEVLVIELDRTTGELSEVAVWAEEGEDLAWFDDQPSLSRRRSSLDGGGIAVSIPGDIAQDVLMDPTLSGLLARRVFSIRNRRRRTRRPDWHNRWLWALVDSCVVSATSALTPVGDWDVSSDDTSVSVLRRKSQREFRRRLMAGGPVECAICGLSVPECLDAAHIIPHARGGAASRENGRLLCANHHRAFDARLYRWTGETFSWAGEGDEPTLGRH